MYVIGSILGHFFFSFAKACKRNAYIENKNINLVSKSKIIVLQFVLIKDVLFPNNVNILFHFHIANGANKL